MAESLTIARPYADAAFKLAVQSGSLPAWSSAIGRLAVVMRTDPARQLIGNPRLGADAIAGLIADAAGELTTEQRNFVRLLAQNDRLAVMQEIASQFEEQRNRHEDVLEVRVRSAFPLSDAQLTDIVATLQEKYGRRIKATADVDTELIGGVAIQVGDEVIDASVRGKLAQLAATLTN